MSDLRGREWEYTQDTCDVWELRLLCNRFADSDWEVVAVVPALSGMKLPEKVGDDNGPLRAGPALLPYVVLFRRPIPYEEIAP